MKNRKLIDTYYKLPEIKRPFIIRRLYNKLLEKVFNILVNHQMPSYYENNPSPSLQPSGNQGHGIEIIASLTSFPGRIKTTYLAIEAILRQSVKPNRIVLWLAGGQFPRHEEDLPERLLQLKNKGLEILFCDDIRSHKKYYYTMKKREGEVIILFDDDLFFHEDVIKNLIEIHLKNPSCVIGTRVHRMTFSPDGMLNNYRKWEINYRGEEASILNHSNSGHGTLVPPSVEFDDIFFNKEIFMKLSPNSDDVWFKVNLIRLGIPVITNGEYARDTLSIKGTYKNSLVSKNTHRGLKDKQFKAVFKYFEIEPTEQSLRGLEIK